MGKKCQIIENKSMDKPSTSMQPVMSSSDSDSDVRDSGVGAFKVNMGARKKVTKQKDCSDKRVSTSGQSRPIDCSDDSQSSKDEHQSGGLQALILREHQKVHQRFDVVEGKVQDHRHHSNRGKDCSKLSNLDYPLKNCCKSEKKF